MNRFKIQMDVGSQWCDVRDSITAETTSTPYTVCFYSSKEEADSEAEILYEECGIITRVVTEDIVEDVNIY